MQNLRIGDFEFLIRVRWNREYTRLEEIFPRVFEKTGVTLSPYYLVVNTSRLFARAHLAHQSAVAIPDRKLCNRSLLGNGKEISTLKRRVRIVSKNLFNVRGRNLRNDLCIYFDRLDRQGAG